MDIWQGGVAADLFHNVRGDVHRHLGVGHDEEHGVAQGLDHAAAPRRHQV